MTNNSRLDLAVFLGWFSLGIGALEIVAPAALSRRLQLPIGSKVVQGFGIREIMTGLLLLRAPASPAGPYARIAGDILDLAVLGLAISRSERHRGAALAATASVVGVSILDLVCTSSLSGRNTPVLLGMRQST